MEFFGKAHTKEFQDQRNLLRNVIRKTQYYFSNELFFQFITELKNTSLFAFKHVFSKNCLFQYHFGFRFIEDYQR